MIKQILGIAKNNSYEYTKTSKFIDFITFTKTKKDIFKSTH